MRVLGRISFILAIGMSAPMSYSGMQCRHLLNASCLSSFAQYYGFLKISAFSSSLPTRRALAVQVLAAL